MADEVDQAQAEEERALEEARRRRKPTLTPAGQCFYCGETVGPTALFCDRDCAAEWDRERDIRARQGR